MGVSVCTHVCTCACACACGACVRVHVRVRVCEFTATKFRKKISSPKKSIFACSHLLALEHFPWFRPIKRSTTA